MAEMRVFGRMAGLGHPDGHGEKLCHWGEYRSRATGSQHREKQAQGGFGISFRCLPGEVFRAGPTRRRPQGKHRIHWKD